MTRHPTDAESTRVPRDYLPNQKETSVKGRVRRSQPSFPEGMTDDELWGLSTKKETTSSVDESSLRGAIASVVDDSTSTTEAMDWNWFGA